MTRLMFLAASLGLAVSGAQACDFMKSAATADTMQTASVTTSESASPRQSTTLPMSTPEAVAAAEPAASGAVVTGQSE